MPHYTTIKRLMEVTRLSNSTIRRKCVNNAPPDKIKMESNFVLIDIDYAGERLNIQDLPKKIREYSEASQDDELNYWKARAEMLEEFNEFLRTELTNALEALRQVPPIVKDLVRVNIAKEINDKKLLQMDVEAFGKEEMTTKPSVGQKEQYRHNKPNIFKSLKNLLYGKEKDDE